MEFAANEYYIIFLQLRNLVWATSKHDVYLMSHYSLVHWSAVTRNKYEVLNLAGHVAPRQVCVLGYGFKYLLKPCEISPFIFLFMLDNFKFTITCNLVSETPRKFN